MSIQILSADVVNQIAAGEVVERPAHLVKELIENSLDAGSDQILVETSSGGRYIRVVDNGNGIESKDLALALKRHATSKINTTEDLWNLSTFGFRGEALASAAAVSKLTLVSKKNNSQAAYQIQSQFGQLSDVFDGSKNQGTEIKIEALFENVPARLKFLKSDSAELAQIKNVVKAMALSNPKVEFKLIDNGKLELYYISRSHMIQRAQDVLGCQKLFFASAQREKYTAEAYFSSPQDVVKTSKNIWIFAQNRWIQDRGLHAAVMEAYRNLLMHGEYPQVVVHLKCDPTEIDVNIHPTKSQVKFQDASLAFRAVQAAVRDGLERAPWILKQETTTAPSEPAHKPTPEYQAPEYKNYSFNEKSFNQTQFKSKNFDIEQLSSLAVEPPVLKKDNHGGGNYWSTFQVIGQAHLTYIVCQKDSQIILVDQHAAHERVAYEKLMRKWQGGQIDQQDYLFPLAIDLSPEKLEALMTYEKQILQMGISIETLGPNVLGIKSAPLFIKESSLPGVFEKMATDILENGGSFNLEKKISDLFATMACHSVVRAGQSLSVTEMKELLFAMDEFPLSCFCPHGRPVSVILEIHEIEKMFGRIN